MIKSLSPEISSRIYYIEHKVLKQGFKTKFKNKF